MRFVWALCIVLFATEARTVELYLSPVGKDTWSGRLAEANVQGSDGPLATLAAAQKAARAARPSKQNPVVVHVRGGRYEPSETLKFDAADSHVTYAAYRDEKPVISGGVRIAMKADQQGRWTAELADVKAGKWGFVQLWVDGQRRYRPRLPKKGYYHVTAKLEPSERSKGKGYDRLGYGGEEIRADWHNLEDVEVIAFQIWTMARMRVHSVEADKKVVNFTGDTRNKTHWSEFGKGKRFFVENVREAHTEPGEFYLDRKSGVLTYIPMAGEDLTKAEVIAPRLETLVEIKGSAGKLVEGLVLRGLTFAHGNWVTPAEGNNHPQAEVNLGGAVSISHARDVALEQCDVQHVGIYAIDIGEDARRVRIESCVLADLGAGGVKIGSTGFEKDERKITSHNVVKNCLITQAGHLHPAAIGVWVGHSPHNVIEHNEISDLYYTGISLGWSWGYDAAGAHHNTVAHNHVHTVGQGVLSDMGGIYTLGLSEGTKVHHNLFHDIRSYDYGGWGIYFDEGTTHLTAENNVVYNTRTGGFHQHYGKENAVRNNIFVNSATDQLQRTRPEPHLSFTFEKNIVYWNTGGKLLGSNWGDDKFTMDRNVYWRADGKPFDFAGMSFADWQAKKKQDVHSLVADPQFVDAGKNVFRLKETSPALKLGFVPIDLAGVGPTKDVLARRPRAVEAGFPIAK